MARGSAWLATRLVSVWFVAGAIHASDRPCYDSSPFGLWRTTYEEGEVNTTGKGRRVTDGARLREEKSVVYGKSEKEKGDPTRHKSLHHATTKLHKQRQICRRMRRCVAMVTGRKRRRKIEIS